MAIVKGGAIMERFGKIKGRMREKGFTQGEVAKRLGISTQAFSSKVNGKTDFRLSELQALCGILEISDPSSYFFTV